MSAEPTAGPRRQPSASSWLVRMFPRIYRLAILGGVAGLLHLAAAKPAAPGTLTLADARRFFPAAEHLSNQVDTRGAQAVRDAAGRTIGALLTTSPHTDDLIGYSGPSNLLVALDPQGKVIGLEILSSGDTTAHVE